MDLNAPPGVLRACAELKDPRVNRTKRHSLADILAIAICALIRCADGWTQVAKFGRRKLKWFRTFLDLPNGFPSRDTFGRVFAAPDPTAFEECFMKWITNSTTASAGRLLAIDGKTIRRGLDAANGKAAIPELLKLLDLGGAVVNPHWSLDINCREDQRRIRQGHYGRKLLTPVPHRAEPAQG